MAAPRNYIPDDIVFSILSKLPVKSLKRFSCVHKSWINLFENRNFFNMFCNNILLKFYSLYVDDDVCLILNQCGWNFYLLDGDKFQNKLKLDLPPYLDSTHEVNDLFILGSGINGILCIYDLDTNREVVLWNPTTNESMKVPYSLPEFPDESSTRILLHGFGYDHVRDDYKIIEHVAYSDDVLLDPFWENYSLKSNSWKKINYDMPIRSLSTGDVCLNGVCCWWAETNNETCLVSFNLCDEVFLTTSSPLADVPDGFHIHLMVLNGSIALISNRKNTTSYQISIFVEFSVEESWIRLFGVELMSFIDWPIGAGTKGKIFFRKKDGKLVCFDITTGLIEDIGFQGEEAVCQVVHYKKNLRSIGEINV